MGRNDRHADRRESGVGRIPDLRDAETATAGRKRCDAQGDKVRAFENEAR
jgi:hypothetical protein